MSGIPRPSRTCAHPGCRTNVVPGNARCQMHLAQQQAQRFMTPAKRANPKVYHSKEYHRERAAVMRDRGHCHLSHLGDCNGTLHYHSTRPPSHARNDCAVLCQRHHMRLEQQGKDGALARALDVVMGMILGGDT
jgi:hypothetical protein